MNLTVPREKELEILKDVRELIKDNAIKKKQSRGVKARAGKLRRRRKKKGRKKGVGKIRKRVKKRKKTYVNNIRKMRRHLTSLKKKGKLDSKKYNKLRKLIKAGHVKNVKNVDEYLGVK